MSSLPSLDLIITEAERNKRRWKYLGYPAFVEFVASDPDLFVLRRFNQLNARVLLQTQDELSQLEDRLQELDRANQAKDAGEINNGSFRHDPCAKRVELLAHISKKLREYNDILLAHSELRSRPKAPNRNIKSVKYWLQREQGAIVEAETKFIDVNKQDLISISSTPKGSLQSWLEQLLYPLWKKDPPAGMTDSNTIYISEKRMNAYSMIAVYLIAIFMLIAPLWVLSVVKRPHVKLTVITVFLVVFLTVLSFATRAQPFEILATTAAYSAVLVVFLQFSSLPSG